MQTIQSVQSRIYEFREKRVILDLDLADLYEVDLNTLRKETKKLLKQLPEEFLFKLNRSEFESIRDQVAALQKQTVDQSLVKQLSGNILDKTLPYGFTAEGALLISKMLTSSTAIKLNIVLAKTFVESQQGSVKGHEFNNVITDNPELKYFLETVENLLNKEAAQVKWEGRKRVGFAN